LIIKPPTDSGGGDEGDSGGGDDSGDEGGGDADSADGAGGDSAEGDGGGTAGGQEVAALPEVIVDVPEVTTGSLCVLAYRDSNRNALRDPGEGLLAGATATLMLTGAEQEMGRYTTTGISPNEPYCFANLEPSNYDLMIAGADLTATTPANIRVGVDAGQIVRIEYGAVPSDAAAEAVPPPAAGSGGLDLGIDLTSGTTVTRLAISAIGAAVVVLFMTVLGAVIYLAFLRPRTR
jgi:hypothetical protein